MAKLSAGERGYKKACECDACANLVEDNNRMPEAGAAVTASSFGIKRICIKEYAKMYGVPGSTVRRWIQKNCVNWEQKAGKKGKIVICVEDG